MAHSTCSWDQNITGRENGYGFKSYFSIVGYNFKMTTCNETTSGMSIDPHKTVAL